MFVAVLFRPVVALHGDDQRTRIFVVVRLHRGSTSVGSICQLVFVVQALHHIIGLSGDEDVLSVISERCEFGVIDEAHIIDNQFVVCRTARHGVRSERSQHILLIGFRIRIFERSGEARPFLAFGNKDGSEGYLVCLVTFFIRGLWVAVAVFIMQDELAATVLAATGSKLGVALHGVRCASKRQTVPCIRKV